jgi:predicted ATPase
MKKESQVLEFSPFRLDLRDQQLWREKRPVELRPKTWELLRHLAERPGCLVSKEELLDAVWQDVEVSPGSLNQAILELRQALGDDAREPRFIETVHRRGFRFVARVRQAPAAAEPRRARGQSLPAFPALATPTERESGPLPGRGPELEQLGELFREARAGRRQIAFVTGEPGIGKTRLLHAFLERLAEDETHEPVRIAGGTCVELHGEGEAYLPILEALERLAREAGAEPVRRVLRRWAPSWLAQLPGLLRPDESKQTPAPLPVATPTRMLREFCVAVEVLSRERPLVLWLEDLHWSDLATLDLLAALAARSEAARLLILATYRPVDAAMRTHPIAPLKRALVAHRGRRELALELLDEMAVRAYLRQRFAAEFEPALAALIHGQTEGNPLFMVTLVNHLVAEGWLARAEADEGWTQALSIEALRGTVPESLKGVVQTQIDRMSAEEVEVLVAGSAVGETFAAQLVAAALDWEVVAVEKVCGRLASGGRLIDAAGAGHWPDGSAGERFRFQHAIFRTVLYQRMATAQRQELHYRIATRLEEGHAGGITSVAAELAAHFERGGDPERAVLHLAEAAAGVRQRSGDREAMAYFDRALALLSTLPDSDDRARHEIELRMHRWTEMNVSTVGSAEDQDASLNRVIELCDRLGDSRARAYASSYRTLSLIVEGELNAAASFDERRVEVASSLADPALLSAGHSAVARIAFYRGELDRAQLEYPLSLDALEGVELQELPLLLGHDPGVLALGHLGCTRWLQGCPDQARLHAGACLARSEALGSPLNRCYALILVLFVEQLRRDAEAAGAFARSLDEIVEEDGFELPYPQFWAVTGWACAHSGEMDAALVRLREGISVARRVRIRQGLSHLLATLAEAELGRGATHEGLAAIDDALAFVEETGERFWEAEIHRLKGELLLLAGEGAQVEACFQTALDVARRQGARSLELRAATSLAGFWKSGSRKDEARALLAPVYDDFTEGLDTLDLREAKTLLDSL